MSSLNSYRMKVSTPANDHQKTFNNDGAGNNRRRDRSPGRPRRDAVRPRNRMTPGAIKDFGLPPQFDNPDKQAEFGRKVARAAAKGLINYGPKGLRFLRFNPYMNAAFVAWDIWEALRMVPKFTAGVAKTPLSAGGWINQAECNLPMTHMGNLSSSTGPFSTTFCLSGQGVVDATEGFNTWINLGRYIEFQFTNYAPGNQPRYSNARWLYRNSTAMAWRPKNNTLPNIKPYPMPFPHLLPIKYVMPLPEPLPMPLVYARTNEPPFSYRDNGPYTPFRYPPRKPPTESVKNEKKLSGVPAVVRALQALGHGASEAIDFVDALHDALPSKLKAKPKRIEGKWFSASPQAKVAAIAAGWDSMDWNEAMKNVAMNHIEDNFFGRASGEASKGLNNSPIGRITGGPVLFLGPR